MQDVRMHEDVRYTFSETEMIDLGQALARDTERVAQLEDEKSTTAADFAARIKEFRQNIRELSKKVAAGFEMRPVEVMIMYEYEQGHKKILRVDTNQVMRVEELTAAEKQYGLNFSDPDADEGGAQS